jgi:hypothetical protein
MPHINIEISHELLTQMQVACAVSKQSQKEFVLRAIAELCTQDWTVTVVPPMEYKSKRVKVADKIEALQEVAQEVLTRDAAVGVCKRCSGMVRRDPKNVKYWYCATCKRQLDDREVC